MKFFHLQGSDNASSSWDPDALAAEQRARMIKIAILCVFWYSFSALSNNICMCITLTHALRWHAIDVFPRLTHFTLPIVCSQVDPAGVSLSSDAYSGSTGIGSLVRPDANETLQVC